MLIWSMKIFNGVLIPYQQGGLFRLWQSLILVKLVRLNPLSAGRSFQTSLVNSACKYGYSLNPLSAGRSFQTYKDGLLVQAITS